MQKVGYTLLFIMFILMIVAGANMALKIGNPYIRRVSTSLADSLM